MKVAFAIKSCHKNADRRKAQMETWIPQLNEDFFFIIGNPTPSDGGPVVLDSLACNVSDSFSDIAPKVLFACEYALDSNITNLCVLDDDTYVVPSRMMKSGFEKFDYFGFVRNYDIIPYMQGSCYWLSERAMERMLMQKDLLVPGVPDDVAVGRTLRGRVPFTHEHRFAIGETEPSPERRPLPTNDIISCHKCHPLFMRAVHEPWRNTTVTV